MKFWSEKHSLNRNWSLLFGYFSQLIFVQNKGLRENFAIHNFNLEFTEQKFNFMQKLTYAVNR